jgi:2-aminoadipate transaminase
MIPFDERLSRASRMQQSEIRRMGALAVRGHDLISFAPGHPDPSVFAWEELAAIAADLLGSREAGVLQYGSTRGDRALLDSLVGVLKARGIGATSDELIVSTGSQQGLDLVARVLLDPGDVALVELPTYAGAIAAFRHTLARPAGVRQGQDGIDLEHLDWRLTREREQGRRVVFLYLTPNFQNPTGLLLSTEKRAALLDWAARRDVLIIEDDPYGVLYFDTVSEADTRPIKADDTEGRVIYLSTFSKVLTPGLRVAWLTAPAPLIEQFETAKGAMDLCSGSLDQRMAHEAIVRGVIARETPKLRAHYQQQRDVMERALHSELSECAWRQPEGGFFVWLELPEGMDGEALLPRAIEQRVLYVAGAPFFVESPERHFIRLAFSGMPPARIVEGVARLSRALRVESGTPVSR